MDREGFVAAREQQTRAAAVALGVASLIDREAVCEPLLPPGIEIEWLDEEPLESSFWLLASGKRYKVTVEEEA